MMSCASIAFSALCRRSACARTAVEFKVKLNECSDKYESRIRLLKEEQIQELAAKHQFTNTESPPPVPVKYCGSYT